jgi:hypothetical protein
MRTFVVAEQFLGQKPNTICPVIDVLTNTPTNENRVYPTGLVWGRGTGIGQIDIEAVKTAQKTISPWLWVFSVVGFGMALMNTHRISKMFGSWKKAKQALK